MRTRVATLVLLVALAAAGCANTMSSAPVPPTVTPTQPIVATAKSTVAPTNPTPQSRFPLTIVDDAQRSVTIQKEPQRIVSLASSNTELVYALGLQDKLVGVDDYSDYPAEAKTKEKVGGFSKPSLEKIVALAPDVVLATNIHLKTVLPELEKQGLTVILFQPPKLENVGTNLRVLGKIGGQEAAGEKMASDLLQRLDAVTAKTKGLTSKPRVFFEMSPDLISVGPDTFVDDMITRAGGDNISRDAKTAWPKLSFEIVVLKDPQVIVLADMGSSQGGVTVDMVKERPAWSNIAAVKSGRIVPLPDTNIINRPGPRAIEGLEFLAKTINPDLFR